MTAENQPLTRKARILLVDDHPIVRQGLAQLISGESDLEISATVEDTRAGLAAINADKPDVAVIDLSLKDGSGLELVKAIKVRWPDLPVLVLSMHDEGLHAERVLRAGAKGYIMKQEATEKVIGAIRKILGGEIYLSERMASQILNQLVGSAGPAATSPIARLTDREYEIFTMIGRGIGTREIAGKLSLSVKTVEAHRENIKDKLNLKNANELLRHAMQHTADLQQ